MNTIWCHRIILIFSFVIIGCGSLKCDDIELLNSINIGKGNHSNQVVWLNNGILVVPIESKILIVKDLDSEDMEYKEIKEYSPIFEAISGDVGLTIPVLYAFSKEHNALNFVYGKTTYAWRTTKLSDNIADDISIPTGQDSYLPPGKNMLFASIKKGILNIINTDGSIIFTTTDFEDFSYSVDYTSAYKVKKTKNRIFIVSNNENLFLGEDNYTFHVQIFKIDGDDIIKELSFEKKYNEEDLYEAIGVVVDPRNTPFPFALGDCMDFVIELGENKYLLPFSSNEEKWKWNIYENGNFTDAKMEPMKPTRNPFTWAVSPDRTKIAYYDISGENLLIYKVKE